MSSVKCVFFDCDGVLNHGIVWGMLNEAAGVSREVERQWYHDYYDGRITFEEWDEKLSKAYRDNKVRKNQLMKAIKTVEINKEAKQLIPQLHLKGIKTAVISSGVDLYVSHIAEILRIPTWRAHFAIHFDAKDYFTKFSFKSAHMDKEKADAVIEICNQYGIRPQETFFVGDSTVDIKSFELTQHGVLYRRDWNEELRDHAWKIIDNLNEIIDLLQ